MTTLPHPRDGHLGAEPALHGLCGGAVHLPGSEGYDAARVPWNTAVEQRPAAVVYPGDATEVADVVRAARRAGLRIAPQGTGHNAGPLGPLDDVVLLRTAAMHDVAVDPTTRTARVGAGVLWQDAVDAAAQHGLAALHGSSPDVGVVGFSLGGGIGWYSRAFGLQAGQLTAVELVTADGLIVRADADHESELFWALRGGGGSFGVVTAVEFSLHDVGRPLAGMMIWDARRARDVLARWALWAGSTPDEATTALRLLRVPPAPEMPDFLRGRQVIVIDGAVLGPHDEAEAIIGPLRDLAPEVDTFAPSAPAGLTRLHMDPEGPSAFVSSSAMLRELPAEGIDALLDVAGPGSSSSLVLAAELRQLGGALARRQPGGGALDRLDAAFTVFAGTVATDDLARATGAADARQVTSSLAPWHASGPYLNLTESAVDPSAAYPAQTWARLQALRAAVDPTGLIVANHPVSAAPAPVVAQPPAPRVVGP